LERVKDENRRLSARNLQLEQRVSPVNQAIESIHTLITNWLFVCWYCLQITSGAGVSHKPPVRAHDRSAHDDQKDSAAAKPKLDEQSSRELLLSN
jgi:hypothetical protein